MYVGKPETWLKSYCLLSCSQKHKRFWTSVRPTTNLGVDELTTRVESFSSWVHKLFELLLIAGQFIEFVDGLLKLNYFRSLKLLAIFFTFILTF